MSEQNMNYMYIHVYTPRVYHWVPIFLVFIFFVYFSCWHKTTSGLNSQIGLLQDLQHGCEHILWATIMLQN